MLKRSGFQRKAYTWKRSARPLGYSKRLRPKPDRALFAWSKAVRERDDYTCYMTGIRDVERNIAHHVCPRSRRPDLRLDVANGITLSPEAHQWVHNFPREAEKRGLLSFESYEKARRA